MSDGVMPLRTSTARVVRRASSDVPVVPTAALPRRHLTPVLGVLSCDAEGDVVEAEA